MKRYLDEAGSEDVARWLSHASVATSAFSQVEITSAICRREREGTLAPAYRQQVVERLARDLRYWTLVEVTRPVLELAGVVELTNHLPLAVWDNELERERVRRFREWDWEPASGGALTSSE